MQAYTLPHRSQPLATFAKAGAVGDAEFTRDLLGRHHVGGCHKNYSKDRSEQRKTELEVQNGCPA